MAEHFESDFLAVRAAYVLFLYGMVYFCDLLHVEFSGKHHHIGELRIESHSLSVAYIDLSGDMHFLSYFACIHYRRHV